MAFTPTLQLYDGTTTISLNDDSTGSMLFDGYAPVNPDQDEMGNWKNVQEGATILLLGGQAAVQTTINSINKIFEQARDFQRRGIGSRCYVYFKLATGDALYRSELVDGRVTFERDELSALSINGSMEVSVIWARKFYWEPQSGDTELSLSNGGGSGTGGRTIYMHDDATAGHDNWVDIVTTVTGDLPAPIRVEVTNSYNAVNRTSKIWVGMNWRSSPTSFPHVLEGEAATGMTPTAAANMSGGSYGTGATLTTSAAEICSWSISSSMAQYGAGNYFIAILRSSYSLSNAYEMQLQIYAGLNAIWASAWAKGTSGYMHELGPIQIPPYLIGSGTMAALTLKLYAKASVSMPMNVDYIQLIATDSFRRYVSRGYDLPYLTTLYDDAPNGYIYTDDGTGKFGNYVAYGEPLTVVPGKTHRMYFLSSDDTGGAPVDKTHSIRAYYRPRRLTI